MELRYSTNLFQFLPGVISRGEGLVRIVLLLLLKPFFHFGICLLPRLAFGEISLAIDSEVYEDHLAGFPITNAPAGTSFVTTEPAPILAFAPIEIPGRIVAFAPIETPFPTMVGSHSLLGGYLSFVKQTCGPMKTSLPILTPVGMKENA